MSYRCPCDQCQPDSPAPTYTAAYRLQCEARTLLTRPLEARRAYLARKGVQPRREALQVEMARLWRAGR